MPYPKHDGPMRFSGLAQETLCIYFKYDNINFMRNFLSGSIRKIIFESNFNTNERYDTKNPNNENKSNLRSKNHSLLNYFQK